MAWISSFFCLVYETEDLFQRHFVLGPSDCIQDLIEEIEIEPVEKTLGTANITHSPHQWDSTLSPTMVSLSGRPLSSRGTWTTGGGERGCCRSSFGRWRRHSGSDSFTIQT